MYKHIQKGFKYEDLLQLLFVDDSHRNKRLRPSESKADCDIFAGTEVAENLEVVRVLFTSLHHALTELDLPTGADNLKLGVSQHWKKDFGQ
jgi:hypothetical protein